MKIDIKVTKTLQSKLSQVDFNNIPFGKTFSDHMFVTEYVDGQWINPRIEPFAPFPMSPANLTLHYGQAIFEGMKASVSTEGQPLFFRPEMHVHRLNASAHRMCMPEVPGELFLEAIHKLVDLEKNWIPPHQGSALYLRPVMFANSEFIGVQPSQEYKFIIFTGPVGPYYPKPVRLKVETEYIRAAQGGIGEAKTAGNYAASLLPAKKAKEAGFDQILWLDAKEFKYVQEVGTMNLFFVIDGKVVTPQTDGAILNGITRNSIITILKDKGYEVEERLIAIDEIVEAYKAGVLDEVFGTGTAAVVAHVSDITYGDLKMTLPPVENRTVAEAAKQEINELRAGTKADDRGWVVPVKAFAQV